MTSDRSKAASLLGIRGGRARAAKLSQARRTEIARKGGVARAVKAGTRKPEPVEAPKRKPPREGTMNAKVLAALRSFWRPVDSAMVGARTDSGFDHEDPAHWKAVRNALSSLRSGGHVVAEGPGREKLWRAV